MVVSKVDMQEEMVKMEMRAIAKAKVGSFNLVSQGNDKQQDELTFAKLKENKVAKENELLE